MKRTVTLVALILVVAFIGGIAGSFFTAKYIDSSVASYKSIEERQNLIQTNFTDSSYRVPKELDFLSPAKNVVAGVVHIRASFGSGLFSLNPLEVASPEEHSSGSGVI